MPLPLWGKIAALSVGKKLAVLLIAKVYGIPKLYRRSQKGARFLLKHDPVSRKLWARRIELGFRLPDRLLSHLKNVTWTGTTAGRATAAATSPTSPALHTLLSHAPTSPASLAGLAPVQQRFAASGLKQTSSKAASAGRLQRLSIKLRARVRAASSSMQQRLPYPGTTSRWTMPFPYQIPTRPSLAVSSLPWTPFPLGSFASQPLLPAPALGRPAPSTSMSQLLLHRVATSLLRAHAVAAEADLARQGAAARGREYLRRAVARRRERQRQKYWQRSASQLGAA